MSLRGWFVSRVEGAPKVTALVSPEMIMTASAAGLPGSPTQEPTKPFMLIRSGAIENRMGVAQSQRFFAYVHDEPGSYIGIEEILNEVKAALLANLPATIGSTRVTAVEWEGDGDDLYDDTFGTITRYAQFRLTGRQVGL